MDIIVHTQVLCLPIKFINLFLFKTTLKIYTHSLECNNKNLKQNKTLRSNLVAKHKECCVLKIEYTPSLSIYISIKR